MIREDALEILEGYSVDARKKRHVREAITFILKDLRKAIELEKLLGNYKDEDVQKIELMVKLTGDGFVREILL